MRLCVYSLHLLLLLHGLPRVSSCSLKAAKGGLGKLIISKCVTVWPVMACTSPRVSPALCPLLFGTGSKLTYTLYSQVVMEHGYMDTITDCDYVTTQSRVRP